MGVLFLHTYDIVNKSYKEVPNVRLSAHPAQAFEHNPRSLAYLS